MKIRNNVFRRTRVVLFAIAWWTLFLMAFQVEDPGDLGEVLPWIASGAGAVFIVNWVASWLAENWVYWQGLAGGVKFAVSALLSIALSFGAQYLMGLPQVVAAIAPYFSQFVTVILILLGYGASQAAHVASDAWGHATGAKDRAAAKKGVPRP